jgi:hypothetical protein
MSPQVFGKRREHGMRSAVRPDFIGQVFLQSADRQPHRFHAPRRVPAPRPPQGSHDWHQILQRLHCLCPLAFRAGRIIQYSLPLQGFPPQFLQLSVLPCAQTALLQQRHAVFLRQER